jgi:hypothetical protein
MKTFIWATDEKPEVNANGKKISKIGINLTGL